MLHLGDVPEPVLPGPDWVRVRPLLSGICGSDLAAIGGHVSMYHDPLTSYPFTLGHELVGRLEDRSRVVIEPALGCAVRGVAEPCDRCREGRPGLCENLTEGPIEVGLQTGYCASTGGGWGELLVAHRSQVHPVPDDLPDEAAVLIEPLACCIHAALRGGVTETDVALVYGAGTIGLLTTAALRRLRPPGHLMVVAKHPHQRAHALRLGADQVVAPEEVYQRVRFATGARRLDSANPSSLTSRRAGLAGIPMVGEDRWGAGPVLLGGVAVTFDCVGTAASLNDCVRLTRAGGTVVAVGMPGEEKVDWTPIWQRELTVTGAYAYGLEASMAGRSTFQLAIEMARDLELERLTGPLFGLGEYREAIAYAMSAGRLGAVKVAFDLRGLQV